MPERVHTPELMDDPALPSAEHVHALHALARVNRLSLAGARVWREVLELHGEKRGQVRVLDVACGGGDVLRDVARRARRARLAVALHGCDLSTVGLEEMLGERSGDAELAFFRLDALRDELPRGYDLICASLFLHHLEDAAAGNLLRRMSEATAYRVLIQDLRRSRVGYALAWAALRVLTTSRVARSDGPTSVRAAFTLPEAERLCREAGLAGAEVRACWPQRFTIRWRRTQARA
jgi:SAM-dependent methyltransferase